MSDSRQAKEIASTARLRKLKPGPGHTRREVGASQRGRLLAAAIALVDERSPDAVTVRGLSTTAGVSTGTFYEHFGNVDECMAAALGWATSRALAGGVEQSRSGRDGPDLGTQLRRLLSWVATERRQSRLLLIDCFGDGTVLRSERRRTERRFEGALGESLGLAAGRSSPSLRGAVAGLTHTARAQLLTGEVTEEPALAAELERWAVSICRPSLQMVERRAAERADPGSEAVESRRRATGELDGDRERVLDAVTKLAVEHGYRSLTGPQIRTQAGVARRRFDHLFTSLEQCFLEAVESVVLGLVEEAGQAGAVAGSWVAGVARGSATMCRELARRPAVARLVLVEILATGPAGLRCREQLVTELAERLRSSASPDWRSSRMEWTASVAAAWRILESEVLAGRERRLPRLAPTIARTLLAPACSGLQETADL